MSERTPQPETVRENKRRRKQSQMMTMTASEAARKILGWPIAFDPVVVIPDPVVDGQKFPSVGQIMAMAVAYADAHADALVRKNPYDRNMVCYYALEEAVTKLHTAALEPGEDDGDE